MKQNKNKPVDIENKLMVAKGEKGRGMRKVLFK